MKLAMLRVAERLEADRLPAKMLLQVHDELMLEVPEDALSDVARAVQSEMENAYRLAVPLVTDAKVGKNWDEMEVWKPR